MSATIPTPYEDLLRDVLANGSHKSDRTGTGTRSVFGRQLRFDLADGFPLITTKRVHFKSIAYELLWFLRGESNVGWLRENGVTIWDEWADPSRRARPGLRRAVALLADPRRQRTSTRSAQVIETLRTDPDSRRIIVSAWNVAEIPQDGARSVPRVLPVLRRRRQAVVPALPAQRRPVPRRPVQHRQLRAADHDGRAAGRAASRASSSGRAATATSTTTTSSRSPSSSRATPSLLPRCASPDAPRRASSTTASRTSSSRTTSTTRPSARRWQCEQLGASSGREARGGVIGAGGTMPWHLPEDLAHFRTLTGSDTVVMGRAPGTRCRSGSARCPGARTSSSPGSRSGRRPVPWSRTPSRTRSPRPADADATIWVIGGAELYAPAIARRRPARGHGDRPRRRRRHLRSGDRRRMVGRARDPATRTGTPPDGAPLPLRALRRVTVRCQPGDQVDGRREDDRAEQVRQQRVPKDRAADVRARDVGVGDLERHPEGERQVGEVAVLRRSPSG